MYILFFLLSLLSFVVMLIGLLKPNLVVRWGKQKVTRKNVFTYYGLASILFLSISLMIEIEEKTLTLLLLLVLVSFLLLIIGLFKPDSVIIWGNKEKKNRKNVLKYYGAALIIFFIMFGIIAPDMDSDKMEEVKIARLERIEEKRAKKELKAKTKSDNKAKADVNKEKEKRAKEELKAKIKADNKANNDVNKKKEEDDKIKKKKEEKKSKDKSSTNIKAEKEIEVKPKVDLDIYIKPDYTMYRNRIEFDIDTNLVDDSILKVTIISANYLEDITEFFTVQNGKAHVIFHDISKLGLGFLDIEIVFAFDESKEQPINVKNTYGENGHKLRGELVGIESIYDEGNYLYYYRKNFKRIH